VYGVFFEPAATFRRLGEESPLYLTLLMVVILYIFGFLIDWGTLRSNLLQSQLLPSNIHLNNLSWLYGLVGLPLSLGGWFVMSALYSLLGNLYYGRNNVRGIMNVLGFSLLPGLLLAPLQVAANSLNWPALSVVVTLGGLGWICGLQIIGLRESLAIGGDQAFALWITPMAAVFVIIMVWIMSFAGLIGQLLG
jgi:hypothetical protein